jgi:dihydroorotase
VRSDPGVAYDTLIAGGDVVLPSGIRRQTIAIAGGRISALLDPDEPASAEGTIDAGGLTVLPGLIDMHVHLREPGQTHKEDFGSGSSAAAAGGFTAIGDMPNTIPPTTTAERLDAKRRLAVGASRVDFAIWGGAGTGERIAELSRAGAAGIKVYMGLETAPGQHSDAPDELVVRDDAALYGILEAAAHAGLLVSAHCGNAVLRSRWRDSWRGKGFPDVAQWLVDEPQVHKVEAVARVLVLAAHVGARVHIAHVPAPALPLVRWAKEQGQQVTAEAALPFATTDRLADLGELGFDRYRSPEDAERLWAAARDGTIDVLATDHAPHTLEEKRLGRGDLLASPSGYPELDTAVPMLLDAVNRGRLTLERLGELMSAAPARLLGLERKGGISVGGDADLVLVDLHRTATIDRRRLLTKAGWSPFEGWRMTGWPVLTMLRGSIIAREGALTPEPASGCFLPGPGQEP